jgi:hypothetical protein
MSWARAALYSAVRRVGLVMLPYVSERSSTLVQGQAQPEAGNFPIHHHQHALPLPDSLPAKTTLSQHLCPDTSPWNLPSTQFLEPLRVLGLTLPPCRRDTYFFHHFVALMERFGEDVRTQAKDSSKSVMNFICRSSLETAPFLKNTAGFPSSRFWMVRWVHDQLSCEMPM